MCKSFFKSLTIFATLTVLVGLTYGNREHKVHNIVLYPDKHSWCTTKQISQVISYPGCKQIVIDNNVCVGACFSYSIPQTEPSDPGEILGPYCDSCQPLETVWHHVTLDCSEQSNKNADDEVRPPTMMKRVQIIKNCSCNSCDKKEENMLQTQSTSSSIISRQSTTSSVNQNYMDSVEHNDVITSNTHQSNIQNDIPELLHVVHLTNENESDVSPSNNYLQQHLFNHYDHNNPSHSADNIKKLLNHKIMTLLKNIQEKNLQHDKNQLIEVLKLIKSTDNDNMNELIEQLKEENGHVDIDRLKEELEISSSENEIEHTVHPHHHNHKHDHHSHMKHLNENNRHGLHGHHRGPHSSLIVDSDEIKEKLVVDQSELIPNNAGNVITYHPHEHKHHHQVHNHKHHNTD